MGRTRIELLSSGDIDMYNDVASPLNYAIADIRTPDKRDASFSKTIKVPGTKGNNIRFGHIFDINIGNGTFNPNIKAPATIYIDDIAVLSGFLQVLSIDIDDEKKIEYNVSIKGKTATLFDTLGASYLTDLDLSSGDHIYNKTVIKASYGNNFTQTYCYPLIDYGFDSNVGSFDVTHLFPSIFVRSYIDKIFSNAGYTYTSSFFNGTIFKQLIIPSNSSSIRLTDAQITPRLFQARRSSLLTIVPNEVVHKLTINSIISDPSSQYSTIASTWTVANTGHYNIYCNYSVRGVSGSAAFPIDTLVRMVKNGTTILASSHDDVYDAAAYTPLSISASNVLLNAGDTIYIDINDTVTSPPSTSSWEFSQIDFWNTVVNNGLADGDQLYLNNTIPQKIKQKDFLLDIIRMFNLFVQVDPSNEKNLLIETRNDFYNAGSTIDWTYKLDNSKNLEIKPMGELDVKDFYYSYTDDKDYYNAKYLNDNANLGYGNRIYVTGNEFLTGKNETKVMFSPTPLVANSGDDKVIPRIWSVDASNTVSAKAFNIRILYNGGVKTTYNPFYLTGAASGTSVESTYLYAGHLDSVASPTFDLSFAVPNELYYDTVTYTDNNIFNAYHRQYIDLITDKDSKIVTGYFYLTPKDIQQLDFRNKFYFDNQAFILNKIYDYDPINDATTKCEFIRLKEGTAFTSRVKTIYGGVGSAFGNLGDTTPVVTGNPRSPITNLGLNNIIGNRVSNSFIQGSSNNINGGDNINLTNSSGDTVYDGLVNVTLLNSSGTTVTCSNVIAINSSGGTISVPGLYINNTYVNASVFNKSYLSVSDSTTQTLVSPNSGQVITFNTDETISGVSHSTVTNTSRITITNAGTYSIHFECQVASSAANKEAYFWLRKNGADVPRTTMTVQIVNANDQKTVTLVFTYNFLVGDYFEVVLGGNSTAINLPANTGVTIPTRPLTPSVILTTEMI